MKVCKNFSLLLWFMEVILVIGCSSNTLCTHNKTRKDIVLHCTETGIEKTICVDCGEVLKEEPRSSIGHSFGNWSITVPATCTEDGTETRFCDRTNCSHFETRIINKSHTWDFGTTTKRPTCLENGEKTYKCTVCGETETKSLQATDHQYTITQSTPVSCTEDGYVKKTCSVCGDVKEETKKGGHRYEGGGCEKCGAYQYKGAKITAYVYSSINDAFQNRNYDTLRFSFSSERTIGLNELIRLKTKYKSKKVTYFVKNRSDWSRDKKYDGSTVWFSRSVSSTIYIVVE